MSEATAAPSPVSLRELVLEAWDNLVALRQRSVLALLGIVIGTASVVAMLSIGDMAGKAAMKPFAAMGVDLLSIRAVGANGEIQPLDLAKLQRLPQSVPGVLGVTGFALGQAGPPIAALDIPPTVVAASPTLRDSVGLRVAEGRFLVDADSNNLVAVIGSEVARSPPPRFDRIVLGERVRAGEYLYQVVGILSPTQQNALSPTDFNRSIIVPFGSAKRSIGRAEPTGALVRMSPEADDKWVSSQVQSALSSGSVGDQVDVQGARQAIATVKAQKAVQARLLAALASISLLVGGLGVMNVMLMGMMERRREIGLRSAIGATPRDIQVMFLTEAVVLSTFGGLIGAVLGILAAFVMAMASHWPFSLALYALPLGAGVAMAVGVIFGLYPAIKAARLDPIEALRAE